MSDAEDVTRSQLVALMLLAENENEPGVHSDAIDDTMLDACFELVLKGLVFEVPGPKGTVWFRITERGAALQRRRGRL